MTTSGDLGVLLALQEHDGALDRLTARRAALPLREELARGAGRAAALEVELTAATARRDELAREEQRIDDEAHSLSARAVDVEKRMYSGEVSSPRELQAMQADVEQLRRHQRTLENRELELMEEREPVDALVTELEEQMQTTRGEVDAVRAALASAEVEIDAEVAGEQAARRAVAAGIDALLVADYERRRARANGVGVAHLVGFTCQGCHLTIPASEAEQIKKAPPGSVAYCDNCGCILVP